MKKTEKRKLTLNKETIKNLEVGKLVEVAGGTAPAPAFSDLWQVTTCMLA